NREHPSRLAYTTDVGGRGQLWGGGSWLVVGGGSGRVSPGRPNTAAPSRPPSAAEGAATNSWKKNPMIILAVSDAELSRLATDERTSGGMSVALRSMKSAALC